MTKYRKKTLIEAEQFDGSRKMMRKYDIEFFKGYTIGDWKSPDEYILEESIPGESVEIDDWIVTGYKGEHYLLEDDVFKATYEKVEE